MPLPRPPISLNTPIPNQPFSAEEVYYLEGNQGHLPLGPGLYIDPSTGQFTNVEPSPYIYCTPQYSHLPISYPPYGCQTEVNTAGVTDFTEAWESCNFTDFPCVDTSSGSNFYYSWAYSDLTSFPSLDTGNGTNFFGTWCGCLDLEAFPLLNFSKGEDFTYTWWQCQSLEAFPTIDISSGTDFAGCWGDCTFSSFPLLNFESALNFGEHPTYGPWYGCENLTDFPPINTANVQTFSWGWSGCSSLTSFPLLDTSSGTEFFYTWSGCISLTTFPEGMFDNCPASDFEGAWTNCALSQQSVDNILISLNTAGQSNGFVTIDGGTSSAPGAAGLSAKASLQGKGWTVYTN